MLKPQVCRSGSKLAFHKNCLKYAHKLTTVFSRVSAHGHLKFTAQNTAVGANTEKPFVCVTHIRTDHRIPWALEIHVPKNGGGRLHGEAICTYSAYTHGPYDHQKWGWAEMGAYLGENGTHAQTIGSSKMGVGAYTEMGAYSGEYGTHAQTIGSSKMGGGCLHGDGCLLGRIRYILVHALYLLLAWTAALLFRQVTLADTLNTSDLDSAKQR